MTKDLPPLIDRFVAAVNRGNTEAFLACFAADGVVDDWGRRFVGHKAIRAWRPASEVRETPQRTLTTNFGSQGAPASYDSSAAFDLKFLVEFAAIAAGTSNRRHWSDEEMIGAKGRMTVNAVEQAGDEVTVTAGWKSNFYSGPSRYVFVVDGDHIREMRITAA